MLVQEMQNWTIQGWSRVPQFFRMAWSALGKSPDEVFQGYLMALTYLDSELGDTQKHWKKVANVYIGSSIHKQKYSIMNKQMYYVLTSPKSLVLERKEWAPTESYRGIWNES
jgi:hypothetical protein